MKRNIYKSYFTLFLAVYFIFSSVMPFGLNPVSAADEQLGTYSAQELSGKAIDFINSEYKSGKDIDGYTAYVLALAGEDLTSEKWSRGDKTLKAELETKTDLLDDNNSLITYVLKTQNADGSFGPLANMYGTKIALQALALVKDDIPTDTLLDSQVNNAIIKAIEYFKSKGYQNGDITYQSAGFDFDYRCVEALAQAGEDLTAIEWVYNGKSLKETVLESAYDAAHNTAEYDDVELAKELDVLSVVEPTSELIAPLADAIISKQSTVNDQVYFGSSIYDDVMVITALGKANKLSSTGKEEQILNYFNEFKTPHSDWFGNNIGVAWGGWEPKEADLTGQVIKALSYFSDSNTVDTQVYNDIKDGLNYLNDIQETDTSAIAAQWDKTAATAETLIALKALGKTYDQYAGIDSKWAKDSKTKSIALALLASNELGDTTRTDRLANILIGRQKTEGSGTGSFENSVYSDMWAYIALGEAGKFDVLNTSDAKAYILSKQSTVNAVYDYYGSWGEFSWDFDQNKEVFYADVLSTIQAMQSLSYFSDFQTNTDIQAAIDKGITYLKSIQQEDGSIVAGYDDAVNDTAELIAMLDKVGQDSESIEWTKSLDGTRVNPVSFLMIKALNQDGSFGSTSNIAAAASALNGYLTIEEEADIIGVVKDGVRYLSDQFHDETVANDTYLFHQQYEDPRGSLALVLANQDIDSEQWTRQGKSLKQRILEKAEALSAEDKVTDTSKVLLSLAGINDSDVLAEKQRLIGLIAGKQQETGNFADGAIYNEMLPYLALTLAQGWDTLSEADKSNAKTWLINAQTREGADKGGWGFSYEMDGVQYSAIDTISTAQAVYVLAHFADAQTEGSDTKQAITDGLAWLKSKQDDTGKINVPWDVPVNDTAETILAVLASGGDPTGPEWTVNGKNLIDYLLLKANQNDNGSIGSESANVSSTVSALLALFEYNDVFGWADFNAVFATPVDNTDNSSDPNTPPTTGPITNDINVGIAIVGKDGSLMYGPRDVSLNEDSAGGLTVLGALKATGLRPEVSGGLVVSIKGVANEGMKGWMYKVNGSSGNGPAGDADVDDGDRVIWWYSEELSDSGPNWDELTDETTEEITTDNLPSIELSDEAQEELDNLTDVFNLDEAGEDLGSLGEVNKAVVVIDSNKRMNRETRRQLKDLLKENKVDISQQVSPSDGGNIADDSGEVQLDIEAGALDSSEDITAEEVDIQEDSSSDLKKAVPNGYNFASSIYRFGPDGTTFKKPAILQLRVAIPALAKAENLSLAWYDTENDKWVSIPAVVDTANGQIVAKVKHFTDFAVFVKESKKSFDDVNKSSYEWAQNSVETMAGAGLVSGVDNEHFQPGRSITRAEFVSLMVRALGLQNDEQEEDAEFSDVSSDAWYAKDVSIAYENGLVQGFGNGTFRPNRSITRQEMAVILAQAIEIEGKEEDLTFTDKNNIAEWAQKSVAAMAKEGLINGFPGGDFRPGSQASRAQAAVIIYNVLASE